MELNSQIAAAKAKRSQIEAEVWARHSNDPLPQGQLYLISELMEPAERRLWSAIGIAISGLDQSRP
jgi:hypothetical protein